MGITTTVLSPVRYTQIDNGPIRDAEGRTLIEGTTTHVLVESIMRRAEATAHCTGAREFVAIEQVHGVTIEAKWIRDVDEDDEPEADATFSLDAVVAALHKKGIPAYVDMTGGGCATIFAGGKHVVLDGTEERIDWDVAAGPGTYSHVADSTASLEEFSVGPNDEGASECESLSPLITTAAEAVAWAVKQIEQTVMETETRSYAEWNKRTCTSCLTATLVPGPGGAWVALDLAPCTSREDGHHTTGWL